MRHQRRIWDARSRALAASHGYVGGTRSRLKKILVRLQRWDALAEKRGTSWVRLHSGHLIRLLRTLTPREWARLIHYTAPVLHKLRGIGIDLKCPQPRRQQPRRLRSLGVLRGYDEQPTRRNLAA